MRYTVRPITDFTVFPGQRRPNPFKASWSNTLQLLGDELDHLQARDVVFEIAVTEADIRLDGMIRANAKVEFPGVKIAFDSKYGPLTYATDRFEGRYYGDPPDWQINIRAIALSLEALRKVDRYGVTRRGEQYTGWKALPPGGIPVEANLSTRAAAEILERHAIGDTGEVRDRTVQQIMTDTAYARNVYKHARAAVHPDHRGGDRTAWDQVEAAAKVLGVLS